MEFERANGMFGALDDAFIFSFSSQPEKTRSGNPRLHPSRRCFLLGIKKKWDMGVWWSSCVLCRRRPTSQFCTPKSRRRERGNTRHIECSEIGLEDIEAKDVGAWNRLVGTRIDDSGEVFGGSGGDFKENMIRVCDFQFGKKWMRNCGWWNYFSEIFLFPATIFFVLNR